ncbi:MAG: CvpA family protein [Oscillospiraceae bacterium]|nr:CvpA family protein [Oscillospiraceae bacterium]
MSIVIDLLLIAIVVYCCWMGLKHGLLSSAVGLAALIAAIFIGHLVGVVYSDEFSGMLQPFAGGLADTAISAVVDYEPGKTTPSGEPLKEPEVVLNTMEKDDAYSVSYAALRELGICETAAEDIAKEVADQQHYVNQEMANSLTSALCDRLGYLAVMIIVTAIVAIIGAIIGNVMNVYFKLPRLETVNKISGSVLGVLKGILLITLIAFACRYLGLVLGNKTIEGTMVLEHLINDNKLAGILGL